MSFILDALRKSDAERQQQVAPGLATAQQRVTKNPRNFWIPALVVVLVLNAAVFGWIYLTGRPDTPAAKPAATPSIPARPAETRSLRKEARQAPDSPATDAPPPNDPRRTETKSESSRAVAADPAVEVTPALPISIGQESPPPAAVPDETSDSIRPALPRFEQLLVAGMISTPPLHLDMHVYAREQQKRFVFINMSKYREGERLSEGPVVDEITSTGVILSHQGNRFTLERN